MTIVVVIHGAAPWTSQLVMIIVILNIAARGTIQFVMVIVIHVIGPLVTQQPVGRFIVIHKRGLSLDVSACDDRRNVKTQPLVGRFNSRWVS